jgi:phage shock protein PspC (stress-responsive transcriptional regulator)
VFSCGMAVIAYLIAIAVMPEEQPQGNWATVRP